MIFWIIIQFLGALLSYQALYLMATKGGAPITIASGAVLTLLFTTNLLGPRLF